MSLQFNVTFDGVDASDALREEILRRAGKVLPLVPEALSATAVVERIVMRHRSGNRFNVRLRLAIPGQRFDVARAGGEPGHEDPLVAVRESFEALRRQIDAHHQAVRDASRRADARATTGSTANS